mmetsp:Transcript_27622/g.55299  ORF Transcript_27622/g.55299 Transcript_27622/m.55299 type:complete len:329 (-) Transcript_27622:31-1017(-)
MKVDQELENNAHDFPHSPHKSAFSLAPTETSSLSDSSSLGCVETVSEKHPGDIMKIYDSLSSEEVEQAALHSFRYYETRDETKRDAYAIAQVRRHYMAEKFDVQSTIRKMKATLKWREKIGIDAMRKTANAENTDCESVNHMRKILEKDMETGKVYVMGYDRDGRALYIVTPAKKNSENEQDVIRSHIYALERCIACTERKTNGELERIICVFDFNNFSRKHSYPLKIIGKVFGVLKAHYPERIANMYFLDTSIVSRSVWAIAKPFVDPVTKKKICFVQGKKLKDKVFESLIGAEQAPPILRSDGKMTTPFNADVFLNVPFDQSYCDV